MDKLKKQVLNIIQTKKSITLIEELLLEIPKQIDEFYKFELNLDDDILTALKHNKITIKRALKQKLYTSNTVQGFQKLNDMLDKEQNSDIIKTFINDVAIEWRNL